MIDISYCNRLLDEGFSLLTVGESKRPNFSWKPQQTKPLSKAEFKKRYSYQGGIKLKDGGELAPTTNVGIITGYKGLECIDVDLKVFNDTKKKKEFWREYLQMLRDNIYDFDEKFVIYKTQSEGFHIIYRCSKIQGNTKIAKPKGHTEAVIESRGVGGYIFVYPDKNLTQATYKDVKEITEEDREILWEVSKCFDYTEKEPVEKPKKYQGSGLTPWEDFNQKNSVIDLISNDFEIVRNLNDRYVIKRFGAESAHSGYVFKNSNLMYLFSTGTTYTAEKVYSPFLVYAHKHHQDDLSEAAKQLYKDGYGERQLPKVDLVEKIEIPKADLIFPVEVFPKPIQQYILENNRTLNNSIDYMGCSLLFSASVVIGNTFVCQIKKGWQEPPNLWIALVGKAGIGKTPSISAITFPLEQSNNMEVKQYHKNLEKYDYYQSLDNKEQDLVEKVKKPKKTQFIVNDVTLEALVEMHSENKNAIGVLRDELAGWFNDMNKYRQGSDLQHWLSSWSGKSIYMNRKTARSSFVQRAFFPVLGGIQPGIMDSFYTDENKDSGFLDRMLFSYPELEIELYNEGELSSDLANFYSAWLIGFYEQIKKLTTYNDEGDIVPHVFNFSAAAKKEWIRIFNEITNLQNSHTENEYMKSMLPKQKSYIPRFALLIEVMTVYSNHQETSLVISKESILAAEKISRYFIAMAKKIKVEGQERQSIKKITKMDIDISDKIKALYKANPKFNKTQVADELNISRQTIYNYINKIKHEK